MKPKPKEIYENFRMLGPRVMMQEYGVAESASSRSNYGGFFFRFVCQKVSLQPHRAVFVIFVRIHWTFSRGIDCAWLPSRSVPLFLFCFRCNIQHCLRDEQNPHTRKIITSEKENLMEMAGGDCTFSFSSLFIHFHQSTVWIAFYIHNRLIISCYENMTQKWTDLNYDIR